MPTNHLAAYYQDVPKPRDKSYAEICRYIVQAAASDYPALPLVASFLSHSFYSGGLTAKQVRALDPHCRLFLGYGTAGE